MSKARWKRTKFGRTLHYLSDDYYVAIVKFAWRDVFYAVHHEGYNRYKKPLGMSCFSTLREAKDYIERGGYERERAEDKLGADTYLRQ